jgi:hypothetical protein
MDVAHAGGKGNGCNEPCKCSGRYQDRQQVGGQFLDEFGVGGEGANERFWC